MNSRGETGLGLTAKAIEQPTRVLSLSPVAIGDRVVKIVCGDHHSLFLTASGRVFACGECNDGQLGIPSDHAAFKGKTPFAVGALWQPVLVKFPDELGDDPITHVTAGPRYNMAITRDGMLLSWGFAQQGELGLSESELAVTPQLVNRIGGPWAARKVSCGGHHAVALFQQR
jgi:regulator of chromosome condensation